MRSGSAPGRARVHPRYHPGTLPPRPGPTGAATPRTHLHEGSRKERPQGGPTSFYTAACGQSQRAAEPPLLSPLAALRVSIRAGSRSRCRRPRGSAQCAPWRLEERSAAQGGLLGRGGGSAVSAPLQHPLGRPALALVSYQFKG